MVVVDAVLVTVTTANGDTATDVAAAVAAAINTDPTLQGLGTTAVAIGDRVVTNGIFASGTSFDLGLLIFLDPLDALRFE